MFAPLVGPIPTDATGQPVTLDLASLYAYFKQQHDLAASQGQTITALQAALAALSTDVGTLKPQTALALANAALGLQQVAALRTQQDTDRAAQATRDALQDAAQQANTLADKATSDREAADRQQLTLLQATQTAQATRLALVEAQAADTKTKSEATAATLAQLQTRLTADEAALATAQTTADTAKANAATAQARADAAMNKAVDAATAAQVADAKAVAAAAQTTALATRVTANETAIAALQARATTDEALITAAQARADVAKAAADAADAKAVALQGALLALQYNESFVERNFRNVAATATGATMPTGQAAQITDPVSSRTGQQLVLDQVPYAFSANPTVAATITLVAAYANGSTQDVLTKLVALTGLPAVGTVVDMLLGQPRIAIALPATLSWKTSSGTLNGKVFGHIEAP